MRYVPKKPAAYVPKTDDDINEEDPIEGEEEEMADPDEEVTDNEDGDDRMRRPAAAMRRPAAAEDTDGDALLDNQIKLMKEYCIKHKVHKPDMQVMNRFLYTPTLKAGAWQKLKAARGKQNMSVQEAWDQISGLKAGKGKTEMKNNTLFLFLKGDPKWAERLESQVQTISRADTTQVKRQQYSRGELEQIHGVSEAQDFIDKGKFIEMEDEWGDKVYVKATKTHTIGNKQEH
eukprot:2321855-Pyramimonas_sp.AAC.1